MWNESRNVDGLLDAEAIETDPVEWTRAMLELFISETEWLLSRIDRGMGELDHVRIRRLLRRQLSSKRRLLADLEAGALDETCERALRDGDRAAARSN